jgi:hypothetical protein
MDTQYHFIPRNGDAAIKVVYGRPEELGEFVRILEVEDIKQLLRDGVRQFVELDVIRQRWIPPSECFEYWKWVRPHIAKEDRSRLEDYPSNFYLSPYEWRTHSSGQRLILFERTH